MCSICPAKHCRQQRILPHMIQKKVSDAMCSTTAPIASTQYVLYIILPRQEVKCEPAPHKSGGLGNLACLLVNVGQQLHKTLPSKFFGSPAAAACSPPCCPLPSPSLFWVLWAADAAVRTSRCLGSCLAGVCLHASDKVMLRCPEAMH